jgi:hypothetical protein
MENPEDFKIKCSRCGGIHTDVTPLSRNEWLSTCSHCFQQDVLTDEMLARARQTNQKIITGQPLVSGKRPPQKGKTLSPAVRNVQTPVGPLIRDAQRRATKTEITNPIIENAKKRAGKAHTETRNV